MDQPEGRLNVTDASFVQTIHTSDVGFQFSAGLGHMRFYPNFGVSQPGCANADCSHARSYELFAESITTANHSVARRCENYAAITSKNCSPSPNVFKMGGELHRSSRVWRDDKGYGGSGGGNVLIFEENDEKQHKRGKKLFGFSF